MIYDDYCSLCSGLARLVDGLSKSWIRVVGHYSQEGINLKQGFFRPEDNAEEMFWLLKNGTAYGGRNGILPLLAEIIRGRLT